jgi:hypothetical protein
MVVEGARAREVMMSLYREARITMRGIAGEDVEGQILFVFLIPKFSHPTTTIVSPEISISDFP